VVDAAGYLVMANRRARSLFDLHLEDLGRPFQDLEVSYRPLELRSKIQQAHLERRPSPVYEVEWPAPLASSSSSRGRSSPWSTPTGCCSGPASTSPT
jgi:hypothetical protein